MVVELKHLETLILFRKVENPVNFSFCTFSEASRPHYRDYGQSGIFTGIF